MKMKTMMGLALAVALIAGMASANYKLAERSSKSMEATLVEIATAYDEVTATIGSMGKLMSSQVGDLRPLLKDFTRQIKVLESTVGPIRSRALSMQEQNKQYFESWAQEIAAIADPSVKAQSQQRLQDTFARYSAVEKGLVQTRDTYITLNTTLNSLTVAMNQDLSPAGLSALRPSYQKAQKEAVATQAAMKATEKAIKVAQQQMTPRASGMVVQ